jgi:DegV family protein with EDD domain
MKPNGVMRSVRVITDSVAQVPSDLARELGISIIPFIVTFQDKSYQDGIDLEPEDLYHRMRVEKIIPKTSAPSPGSYVNVMEKCIDDGATELLCIVLSGNLSGSINAAIQAAGLIRDDHPDITIEVLDSKSAAIAEGFMAIAAARAARQGSSLGDICRIAREVRKRTGIVVSFDTLEYLALGGRIGKAAYLLGDLIDIKPIIALDQEGLVSPVGKVFGNQKALEAILEYVKDATSGCKRLSLAVMDADAADRAEELKRMALQQLKPAEIFHTTITPVMGAHTGPGLVGLGYYYD